jgi:hypothetical protein
MSLPVLLLCKCPLVSLLGDSAKQESRQAREQNQARSVRVPQKLQREKSPRRSTRAWVIDEMKAYSSSCTTDRSWRSRLVCPYLTVVPHGHVAADGGEARE